MRTLDRTKNCIELYPVDPEDGAQWMQDGIRYYPNGNQVGEDPEGYVEPSAIQADYSCVLCGYDAKTKKELDNHLLVAHRPPSKDIPPIVKTAVKEMFPCDFCEFEAKSVRGLEMHVNARHTDILDGDTNGLESE